MIAITGGDLVLPDRILSSASLLVEDARIAAIQRQPSIDPAGATVIDASDGYVVPGFVDVHVHGVEGYDTLDGPGAVAAIAERLPRYGVTAFCPTTVACSPTALRGFLQQVERARVSRPAGSARVLPAHLESNFISPEYAGAQPPACLRMPPAAEGGARGDGTARVGADRHKEGGDERAQPHEGGDTDFTAADILDAIAAARPDIGIVTLAPELPGAIDLVRALVTAGHRVSLGHSGADFDTAIAAIEAGARHATHLFNRMTPIAHRAPGLAGAILAREEVAAELICDGYHVHPAMCRMALSAKGVGGIMAITDGTAGSGLQPGATARLGGRGIRVGTEAALLADGTLAGSTLTMDRAFRNVVAQFGGSMVDAAMVCSTTPARELGLTGFGVIAQGMWADLVVLDRALRVVRTMINGELV